MRQISDQSASLLSLEAKKTYLQRIIRKYAQRARARGLSYPEQVHERSLRKQITAVRTKIRSTGTSSMQLLGLPLFAFGTIEWQLLYRIRGQNEGINGILKRKGNLIGDGQAQTWLRSRSRIRARVNTIIAMQKYAALVHYVITEDPRHGLRLIYNWDHIFFILVLF